MSKTTQSIPIETLGKNKKKATLKEQQKVEVSNKVETQKAVEKATLAETIQEKVSSTNGSTLSKKTTKVRGKKYQKAKKLVDVNKYYSLKEAIKLVKETSFSKFDGKIEAHITTIDIGNVGDITFPYLKTISKKIIVLNDTTLAEIKNGQVNFDILIATPSTMPKLLPYARILGPKGLMPNPKNGTLTNDTEAAIKKLSVAKTSLKTEKKAPVIHIVVGKVSQPIEELTANINELINVVNFNKIKKLALCATMGPCVKVQIK